MRGSCCCIAPARANYFLRAVPGSTADFSRGSAHATFCTFTRTNWFSEERVVADVLVRQLEGHPHTPCLRAASEAAWSLNGLLGWSPPLWTAIPNGAIPELDSLRSMSQGGWQHEAASELALRCTLVPRVASRGSNLSSSGSSCCAASISSCRCGLEPTAADTRRLEVVADGFPLFGGAQLA